MHRWIFFFFIFQINLLFGQSQKDLEIINNLISQSAISFINKSQIDSIENLSLNVLTNNEILKVLFINHFREKITSNENFAKYRLDIVVNKFEVNYPEVVSYPLFGKERIKRNYELDASYILREGEKVLLIENSQLSHTDTVNLEDLSDKLGDDDFQKKLPKVSIYRRIVEPTLITAITGTIVYLFFITRSK